jgi:hypothetical protein
MIYGDYKLEVFENVMNGKYMACATRVDKPGWIVASAYNHETQDDALTQLKTQLPPTKG